jgi:hypothetical protein
VTALRIIGPAMFLALAAACEDQDRAVLVLSFGRACNA